MELLHLSYQFWRTNLYNVCTTPAVQLDYCLGVRTWHAATPRQIVHSLVLPADERVVVELIVAT